MRQAKPFGREHDNGRAMFEPAQFFPLAKCVCAWNFVGAFPAQVHQDIDCMKTDARHQNGGDRNDRQRMIGCADSSSQNGALVFTEQTFDPLESDWIDIPDVAAEISDVI